jgi:C-terminal processing protease CtpA/Prc
MKRVFLFCFTFILSIFSIQLQAQTYDKNCIYGITFEVSKNPSWGFGELVVTDVEPNSAAEASGIKVGDIIMEINGKATYLRDNQTIANWMFREVDPRVKFTIRNVETYFKEYTIERKCINPNAVSERDLSYIFSFYSLEDTNHQRFILPIQLESNPNATYNDYHTYDFSQTTSDTPELDNAIMAILEKELRKVGLLRDTFDPDIIVQPYYYFYSNPKYSGLNIDASHHAKTWRFDTEKQKMKLYPIFDPKDPTAADKSQYISEFGISFYDRKYIKPDQMTQIWDCNIKDYLSEKYALQDYIKAHAPLMLMQYPYATSKTEGIYDIKFNKYNYTGLYFDADNLSRIKDVDPDSPAYKAGLREGYIIKKINDKKLEYTWESLSDGYKLFINETTKYRDESTRFTNAEGYNDCMFWSKPYYSNIAGEFNKTKYQTIFSYLYNFQPYINDKFSDKIVFEVWDGMQTRIFSVTPEIKKSVIIKAL